MSDKVKPSKYLKRKLKKAKLVKGSEKLTLKKFVKSILDDDKVAQSWKYNKSAAVNDTSKAARIKNKGARIAAEKSSTKASRKRGKGGGGSKPAA
jgi:hypothetical protein